jgi:hypothetical protein
VLRQRQEPSASLVGSKARLEVVEEDTAHRNGIVRAGDFGHPPHASSPLRIANAATYASRRLPLRFSGRLPSG